mmetsp:Transcript_64122/g.128733  ORF Transcript_64122/g.128733 Transcript_64122/m.128733 type:complete len:241 (-) Transcript_64122:131-853(-)
MMLGTVRRAASSLQSYPLALGASSLALQNAGFWIWLLPWADGRHRAEIAALALATGCTLLMLPTTCALARAGTGGRPLHACGAVLLLLLSAAGATLGWYNNFQDEYFLEDCYYADWKGACLAPRYTFKDILYDFIYREKCMLARMGDPSSLEVKERQCYVVFTTRLPLCLKVAAQCLAAAVVIGGLIAYDSQPLAGQRSLDEDSILAEARAEERMQERGPALQSLEHRRPAPQALGDGED